MQAEDGIPLIAVLYPARAVNAPGIVLVHRYGAERGVWAEFAPALQREGYAVLAFDLRGHGQSVGEGGNPLDAKDFASADWFAAARDMTLAKAALVEHGADVRRIALLGEHLGGILALQYAVQDKEIAALVLLSPGLEIRGVEATGLVGRLQGRPLLLLAAEQDAYAASSARTLHAEAPGFSELRIYPGSAHGAGILATSPKAQRETLDWLERYFTKAEVKTD